MNTPAVEPRRPGRPPKQSVDAAGAIRKAALQAFSQSGFLGTSIADIAKLAGVAKPLVHYHFASKDELWQAAVSEAFASLQAELQAFGQQMTQTDPREAIRSAAHQLVMFSSRHPQIVRIVVDETGKSSPRGQWLTERYLVPMYGLAKGLLEGFRATTGLSAPPPPAEVLIPALMGIMNFAFLDADAIAKAFGTDVYSEAYVQQLGDLLFLLVSKAFLSG